MDGFRVHEQKFHPKTSVEDEGEMDVEAISVGEMDQFYSRLLFDTPGSKEKVQEGSYSAAPAP